MLRTFILTCTVMGLGAWALPGVTQTTAQSKGSLPDLAWIAGCWASDSGEVGSGEQWMPLAGGSMLGTSRSVKGGKTVAFEFMQIREGKDGVPVFIALPSGQRETHFPLASNADGAAVFENPAHDFPQRVIYKRVGANQLKARIEGTQSGAARGIDFPMKRVGCDAQLTAR